MANEPTTQQEFIDYTFRALGQGVIKVQVSPEQAEERLLEALDFFYERHPDFQYRTLFPYQMTAPDVSSRSINVDNIGGAIGSSGASGASGWPRGTDIVSVKKVCNAGTNYSGDYMFDIRYQMALFDVFGLYYNNFGYSANPLAGYYSTMSYLQLVNDIFNYPINFEFQRTTRRLTLETASTDLPVGRYVIIEARAKIDPSLYPSVWAVRIFKKYYAAMLKKQWADNLSKFVGVPMIGGAQLNAAAMKSEAIAELADVKMQIEQEYMELPLPRIF